MDSDPNLRTYPDVGDKAFGAQGRLVVSLFMNLNKLYLVATGFLILVGDNLHNLFPNVELSGKQTFVLLASLIIMPTVWIDDLTTLSYVSATGVAASFVIGGSVLWSGAFDGVGFHHKGELFQWSGLPTSLSLYMLCYCGHPVFPTLYTSMRNPKHFKWVLVVCFVITTFACASMAVIGYLMFRSELESQITLNLPMSRLSSKVATYTALVNPLAKYALFMKPIVDAIESRRLVSVHHTRVCSLCTRTMLLGSSVAVALTLPYYEPTRF